MFLAINNISYKKEEIKMREFKATVTGIANYLLERVQKLERDNDTLKHQVSMTQAALNAYERDFKADHDELEELKRIIRKFSEKKTVCGDSVDTDYYIEFETVTRWHNEHEYNLILNILEEDC